MSGLPFLILAYYFAFVSYIYDHALFFGPAFLVVWLLLFVPTRTWTKLRSKLAGLVAPPVRKYVRRDSGPAAPRRTRPARELRDSLGAAIVMPIHDRPLDHAH